MIKKKFTSKSCFLDHKAISKLPILLGVAGLIAIISVLIIFSIIPAAISNPLSFDAAKNRAKQYVTQYFGEDLEIHEIMEFSNNFYVLIQEKSTGVNAFELLVDRYSGGVTPEPGPNMMWNSKYQMSMHHDSYPSGPMTVDSDQASAVAQEWLNSNFPGSKVMEPMEFYGYYTFDFSRDGITVGMLSVNGYSGEVWYHNWHGQFITSKDYT